MKGKIISLAALLVMLAGAAMLLYPVVSNAIYQAQQQQLIDYYNQTSADMPADEKSAERAACEQYNQTLIDGGVLLTDPFDASQLDPTSHPYVDLLNIGADGAMGSVEIPSIDVHLTIYHGTEEAVLQKGVGHLQGSSLPVGGTGTHAVLSTHTGLADKKLFTDLDQVRAGDVFYIHVLGDTLAYEVDQIHVVTPDDTRDLMIDATQDYVTLVTCTPYGINSHRLLVRGHRIPYDPAAAADTPAAESHWARGYLYAALAILAVLVVATQVRRRRQQHNNDSNK